MTSPLITLTTDFGAASPYVPCMKGVIFTICPQARIIDLSHQIRPQDVRHANYFLATAIPYFPAGTIHVAVVDPGVGTDRPALAIQLGGHILVGPDNGLFTTLMASASGSEKPLIRRLINPQFWRRTISSTFHGRDVFAPVAAHLACGVGLEELGPLVDDYVRLPLHHAIRRHDHLAGEIQFIDDFGNLISNIPAEMVTALPVKVALGEEREHSLRWVRTYGDAAPGELICLFSSDGFFEIAEVNGNAARRLAAQVGTPLRLHLQ